MNELIRMVQLSTGREFLVTQKRANTIQFLQNPAHNISISEPFNAMVIQSDFGLHNTKLMVHGGVIDFEVMV